MRIVHAHTHITCSSCVIVCLVKVCMFVSLSLTYVVHVYCKLIIIIIIFALILLYGIIHTGKLVLFANITFTR